MRSVSSVLSAGVTSESRVEVPGSNVTPAVRTSRITRVLEDLRAARARGFCSWNWYREGRPNDRNAPSEISDLPGYVLRSAPCPEDDHPRDGNYARHWLVREPTEQLAIF